MIFKQHHTVPNFRQETSTEFTIKHYNKYWAYWAIAILTAFFIQVCTVDVLPSLMQDEAQITDYGRLTLDPLSSWSVTWIIAGNKPLLLWSYLGPLIDEIGFRLGGPSGVGPRVASLLGGVFAGTMAFGWLLSRKVPLYAAWLLAFAFLLDPLFTLSQRMARVDSWVIGLCLASCWLLRLPPMKNQSSKTGRLLAAGALAAAASFVWPSALFMYPLICLELFQAIRINGNGPVGSKYMASHFIYFLAGGIVTAVLLLIPIWHHLAIIFGDMRNMVALNVNSSKSGTDRFFGLFSAQPWWKMIKAFVKTLSPLLPLLALWAALYRREKSIVFTTIVTLALIFLSLVYEFRLLYLLPYFLALIGGLFEHLEYRPINRVIRRISVVSLAIIVAWSVGVTIFLRSALALNDKALLDRNLLHEAAASSIGQGNYKVFLAFTYEFYFAGRSLGWQVYTPYIQYRYDAAGNWIRDDDYKPQEKFVNLMSTMDYAIFSKGTITSDLVDQLSQSGLDYQRSFEVGNPAMKKNGGQSHNRLYTVLLWFLQGRDNYGTYLLYARPKAVVTLSNPG